VTPRWGHAAAAALAPLVLVVLANASADVAARVDDAVPHLPARLADTGLYADGRLDRIAPDVRAFSPQYPLWSDGAAKRRWVWLPPGTSIDGTRLHDWEFPVGTRFWKEFSIGGRRVETRMLWQAARGRWVAASYAWNAEGTDATLAPAEGLAAVADLGHGKRHAIPSRSDCLACHGAPGRTRPLGFTALQLSDDRDPLAIHGEPRPEGALSLGSLVATGLLTLAGPGPAPRPRIATADPSTRAVLGYLAANCGGCHGRDGDVPAVTPFLRPESLVTDGDAVTRAMTERLTTWQVPGHEDGTKLIDALVPQASALLARMKSRRPSSQMPPLGTVVRDDDAVAALQGWIEAQARRRVETSQ
jgi:cytochrome c553